MAVDYLTTRIGLLKIDASAHALTHVTFVDAQDEPAQSNPISAAAVSQLAEYFAGQRCAFNLPLAPTGSDFQTRVWQSLLSVPYGQTASYANIAQHIGKPTASRAVGAANGRNPIAIIIPCHRVIGTSGALTGYAGGLVRKQWLLSHEQTHSRIHEHQNRIEN